MEVAKKEQKVSFFLSPPCIGVCTANLELGFCGWGKQLGIRASSTCVLNFDDMVVPAANVVGEIGKGYKVLFSFFLSFYLSSSSFPFLPLLSTFLLSFFF